MVKYIFPVNILIEEKWAQLYIIALVKKNTLVSINLSSTRKLHSHRLSYTKHWHIRVTTEAYIATFL